MIYNKDASFPYPVLSRRSHSFINNYFEFDIVEVKENNEQYVFSFNYSLGSPFIEQMLEEQRAVLVLIAQSGDNYFKRLDKNDHEFTLSKKRFSLSDRTKMQLHIQSVEDISFSNASDLNDFYLNFKDEIVVQRHSLLGFSDEVVLESSEIKPLDIFEQSIREDLSVPFKIELTKENIILVFKNQKDSLELSGIHSGIRNMYLYLGLSRALREFIAIYGPDEEYVDIDNIQISKDDGLHYKLRDLMLSKNIQELSIDDIDSVIQIISDDIIGKYVDSVRGMLEDGN